MVRVSSNARQAAGRAADELDHVDRITIGREDIPLDDELRATVHDLLRNVASGQTVSVVRREEMLTTQQAADRLHVSRPTLVKMLDDGLIPYYRPGTHRRISSDDLDKFIESLPERRRAGLEDLAESFDPDVPDTIVTTR